MIRNDSEKSLKLRELSDDELIAVTGGDGSTSSDPGDGSSDGIGVPTGQRMHKPYTAGH